MKIENKSNGENCPSHIELGLKKPMSKYMLKDIPQLQEEIAELFSNLLGPLPLKLPPLHEVLHEIPLIDESTNLSIDCLSVQRPFVLNSLVKLKDTPLQDGGYQQRINKQRLCFVSQRRTVHYAPCSI